LPKPVNLTYPGKRAKEVRKRGKWRRVQAYSKKLIGNRQSRKKGEKGDPEKKCPAVCGFSDYTNGTGWYKGEKIEVKGESKKRASDEGLEKKKKRRSGRKDIDGAKLGPETKRSEKNCNSIRDLFKTRKKKQLHFPCQTNHRLEDAHRGEKKNGRLNFWDSDVKGRDAGKKGQAGYVFPLQGGEKRWTVEGEGRGKQQLGGRNLQ